MTQDITLFALSTCAWCRRIKTFLEKNKVEYMCYDVDLLEPDKKVEVREELAKLNPRRSYPTLVVGGNVIVGYHEEEIKDALNI